MDAVATKKDDSKATAVTAAPQVLQPIQENDQETVTDIGVPLYMQRALNTCGSMPPPAQRKPELTVGKPNDIYEQQADEVADKAMRMPASAVAQSFGEAQEELPQQAPLMQKKSAIPLYVRRLCAECDTELAQPDKQREKSVTIPQRKFNSGASAGAWFVQKKVTVSAPGDLYEQEADDVASKVVSGQKVAHISRLGSNGNAQNVSRQPYNTASTSLPAEQGRLAVQAKPDSAPPAVGVDESQLESRIKSPGSGTPLPEGMRREVESSVSADFSNVRVHGSAADRETAAQLNAKAFTYGNHIWLGPGAAVDDRQLMAHELTHVVQQGGALRRTPGAQSDDAAIPTTVQAAFVQKDDGDWDILGGIRRRIESLVDGLRAGWDTVSNIATSAFEGFNSFLGSAMGNISDLVNSVTSAAQQGWEVASDTVTQLTNGVREQLGSWVSSVAGAADAIRVAVMRMDAEAIRAAWEALKGIVGNVWSQLQQAQAALFERIASLWEGIQSSFQVAWSMAQSVFNLIYDSIAEQVGRIRERIEDAWNLVKARANEMGGIAGEVIQVIQAAVERLMSWARDIWDSIQEQWDALKSRIGELLSSAREQMNGFWDALKITADLIWEGIKLGWQSLEGWAIGLVDDLVGGVRDIWQRISGLSVGNIVRKIASYFEFTQAVQRGIDDPDAVLEEYAMPVAQQLEAGMPAEAERIGQENMAAAQAQVPGEESAAEITVYREILVQRDERSVTPPAVLWEGFVHALTEKWLKLDILDLVKNVFTTLIWPWPTVGEQLSALWEDWTNAAGDLFVPRNPFEDPVGTLHDLWSDFLALGDFVLAFWRRINNIALALMGWITVALMIIGAIGGTVGGTVIGGIASALASLGIATGAGAAAGGAAGGFAGAGAGFGVAMALGELFVISFGAAEGVSLVKMFVDLLSARQTDDQKTRDFNQAADNVLALGILAVLLLLAWIAGRIASAAAVLFEKVPLPRGLLRAYEQFREGVKSTRRSGEGEQSEEGGTTEEETPTEETPTEETPTEETPTEETPTEETPTEETPTEETPTEERPTEERPTEERPTEERPTEERPTEETPAEMLDANMEALQREMVDSRGALEDVKENFRDSEVNELRSDAAVKKELSSLEAEVDSLGREWQRLRQQVEDLKAQVDDPSVANDPDLARIAADEAEALRNRANELRSEAERIRENVDERVRQHQKEVAERLRIRDAAEENAREAEESANNICDETDGTNRPDANIGDGTTEAILREELRTGEPINSPEGHHIKAAESVRGLQRAIQGMKDARPFIEDEALLRSVDDTIARANDRVARLQDALNEWNQRGTTHTDVFNPDGSSKVRLGWP